MNLDKNVKAAEASLKTEKAQVEAEKQQARERTAVDQAAAQQLQTERAGLVKDITPSTYGRYERVRKGRRGIAIAEVLEGRCSACNISIRPQLFQDLRKGEQLMSCESCQRILYYHPPATSLEDLTGEPAPAVRE